MDRAVMEDGPAAQGQPGRSVWRSGHFASRIDIQAHKLQRWNRQCRAICPRTALILPYDRTAGTLRARPDVMEDRGRGLALYIVYEEMGAGSPLERRGEAASVDFAAGTASP